MADTPTPRPAYMTADRLAQELCISADTVLEMTRRGVIPQPCELSRGCVRWRWADVDAALAARRRGGDDQGASDPFIAGAVNATKEEAQRRRDRAA